MSESNYSLKNSDNFNKKLDIDTNKIIQRYSELIIQYLKFTIENKNIKTKNTTLLSFIITRGFETITHVFCFLLYYTKNIDVTYFHSQKSFYFYVEFIGQISEDENMFLQLNSRDASIYVYKKTIYEINVETKQTINTEVSQHENELNDKLNEINFYVNLYKTFLYKIIQNNDFNDIHIDALQNIYNKLNSHKLKKNILIYFDTIIDKLFYKINSSHIFFEICLKIINKMNHTSFELILNKYLDKLLSDDLTTYLEESNNTFINWFFN